MAVVVLSTLAAFTYAQNNGGEDEKTSKKIEKKVEIKEVNGEKTVSITTIENGIEKKEVLTGEEAEKYLTGESSWFSKDGANIKINCNEIKDLSSTSNCKVIILEENDMNDEDLMKVLSDLENMKCAMQWVEIELNSENNSESSKVGVINIIDKEIFITGDNQIINLNTESKTEDEKVEQVKIEVRINKTKHENSPEIIKDVKIENTNQLNIYPNPANDQLTIEFSTPTSDHASVELLDLNGKVIYTENISGNTNYKKMINSGLMPNGVYLLQVKQGTFLQNIKLVIQH